MSISLYRKYRPNTFADVVGQEHVENTLTNAVASGDVAHAYLFCGPRGTGKTTSARLLAKALLCESGPTPAPDGSCSQCQQIADGTHPDVYELDAASRTGVENVREEIVSRVQFAPTRGRYKIYIIDEVHMLSNAAFNALLKTLEEPPAHVVFVMCTTDPHKVPETIQSRCQRFDFRRFSIDEICSYLSRICKSEGFNADKEALEFIAAKAQGGMRDATTALEQVAVAGGGTITLAAAQTQLGQTDTGTLFELGGYVAARDTANAFLWLNRMVVAGQDLVQIASDVTDHVRNLYAASLTGGVNGVIACPAEEVARYQNQAAAFGGPERLGRALTTCGNLIAELRNSVNVRLSFEIALTRLCRAESELTLEALAERIESLEAGIAAPKLSGDLLSSMAAQAVASAASAAGMVGAAAAAVPAASAAAAAPAFAEEAASPLGASSPAGNDAALAAGSAFEPAVQDEEEEEEWTGQQDDDAELPWDDDPSIAASYPAPVYDEPAGGDTDFDAAAVAAEPAPIEAPAPTTQPAAQPAAQPQPQQTAQPAAQPAPAAAMSPARLIAAIRTAVKREDVATDALLNGVAVEHDEAGYHLVFPASGTFAMKLVMQGAAHELLKRAFESVIGQPVGFDCKLAGSATAAASKPAAQQPVSFGTVSAVEAAAPVSDYDDGYLDALADSYAGGYDDYAAADEPPVDVPAAMPAAASSAAPEPAPADDFGGFDPGAYMAQREADAAAAAADVTAEAASQPQEPASAFGTGSPVDSATASELADTLSVFGGGIKFEEM